MRRLLILLLTMAAGSSLAAAQKHVELTERRKAVAKPATPANAPDLRAQFVNYASPPWVNWQNLWSNNPWTNG